MKPIGGTLRAARQQRKLTLREVEKRSRIFAKETGYDFYAISASWLGRLEQAEHKLTANKLLALAHVYGMHPEGLLGSIYPDALGRDPPPDVTSRPPPGSGRLEGAYRWGVIGNQDHTLSPLIPAGSVVLIDTRRRLIPPAKEWAHKLQRPIYFLMVRNAYFCGWCELEAARERLTLVPHLLSHASNRSWDLKEVEILGRVIAVSIRFTSHMLSL
jgi:transcriptional regulator with XRE-family HTH domain